MNIFEGLSRQKVNYYNNPNATRIPYIRTNNIDNGIIEIKNLKYLETEDVYNASNFLVHEKDIVLCNSGDIGKLALVTRSMRNALCDNHLFVLRPTNEDVNSEYIYQVLSSGYVQNRITRLGKGTVVKFLSLQDLRAIKIPFYPRLKQDFIVKLIKSHQVRKTISKFLEETGELGLEELIKRGESDILEFKSSLFVPSGNQHDKGESIPILKTIVAFMNSEGGTLLLGVKNDGEICGIEEDFEKLGGKKNWDIWLLHLSELIKNHIGIEYSASIKLEKVLYQSLIVAAIHVQKAFKPAFLIVNKNGEKISEFCVRSMSSTRFLDSKRTHEYILDNWKHG